MQERDGTEKGQRHEHSGTEFVIAEIQITEMGEQNKRHDI
jgi:hypothetical protein